MPPFVRHLTDITSRQQQTQRTLLDWLRVEYAIEKLSTKHLSVADLHSDTWVGEVKRIRGNKRPLSAARLHASRDGYTRTTVPALAAESLTLERTLGDLVNQAYGLIPAEIERMWPIAPHAHSAAQCRWDLKTLIPEGCECSYPTESRLDPSLRKYSYSRLDDEPWALVIMPVPTRPASCVCRMNVS